VACRRPETVDGRLPEETTTPSRCEDFWLWAAARERLQSRGIRVVQTRKQELMMVIDDAVLDINAAVVYANYSKQEHSDFRCQRRRDAGLSGEVVNTENGKALHRRRLAEAQEHRYSVWRPK
jgi:hypothetical protein